MQEMREGAGAVEAPEIASGVGGGEAGASSQIGAPEVGAAEGQQADVSGGRQEGKQASEQEGKGSSGYAGMSRRSFAIGAGGAVALLAMGGLKAVPAQAQVRPPGGQDESRLIASCIRCERCIEACPRGALVPAHIEDGLLGARTPVVDFDSGWCDFCAADNGGVPRCVELCPTSALSLGAGATAQSTILGKATIIKDWCLAWDKNNGCKFCYDACLYDAIELDEFGRPVVVPERCNGCGACQNACVSLKEGSIAVGATSRAIVVVPEEEA